jgi:hypothetical protein
VLNDLLAVSYLNNSDEMNERRSVEETWFRKAVVKKLLSSHEGESFGPHNAFGNVTI